MNDLDAIAAVARTAGHQPTASQERQTHAGGFVPTEWPNGDSPWDRAKRSREYDAARKGRT